MVPQIVGGIVAKKSHDTQADLVGRTKLDMPTGVVDAERILRENADQGLPGYDKYKGDIMGTMAQGLSAYKDVIDNPAAILGALSSSQTNMNDALSELSIKDAMTKLQNEQSLAGFLGGTKAGTQMHINEYNNQMKIGAGEEKQRGTAELMQGITNGISSGVQTYGNEKQLGFTEDMLKNMSNYWKTSGNTPVSAPTQMGAPPFDPNFNLSKIDASNIGGFHNYQQGDWMKKMLSGVFGNPTLKLQ